MSAHGLQHRRVHNILLMQKHLTLREGFSPLTLVLDTIEQSAKPLTQRYIQNAKIFKTDVIFVSYETLKAPANITSFVKARRKTPATMWKEIGTTLSPSKRTLLIIDTLQPLATDPTVILPNFLSSLITTPSISLLVIYHTDIPLPAPSIPTYSPTPLALLRYLATTIFTLHSLPQILARKRAAEKSLAEPVSGLAEEKEGVLCGIGANASEGFVLEMESRRKSGRSIEEWFFLPSPPVRKGQDATISGGARDGRPILLDDHPVYSGGTVILGPKPREEGSELGASTFDLGLTAKQRKDRGEVVLPYFDAQSGGGGTGGRILYDMGVEDDFDDEDDEI